MSHILIGLSYFAVFAIGVYAGMFVRALCAAAKKGDENNIAQKGDEDHE